MFKNLNYEGNGDFFVVELELEIIICILIILCKDDIEYLSDNIVMLDVIF